MTAEQMFEALGYVRLVEDKNIMIWMGNHDDIWIEFDLVESKYFITKYEEATSIKVSLHKAITQQMKELGWL